MRNNTKGKILAPILCAGAALLFLGGVLIVLVSTMMGVGPAEGTVIGIFAVYALVILAVIIGVIGALFQRLREIRGGEADEAKCYVGRCDVHAVQLLSALLLLWLRSGLEPAGFLSKLLLVFAVLDLGSIIPVWISLKQRLTEIKGGEEDAAAQY